MGVKSINNTDRLYWLGRYSERVYTTLRLYGRSYDQMIEEMEGGYEGFCKSLEIPNIYTSAENFQVRYPFDETDVNSIMSNLIRAYDNAIELREEIGSEALSYIQLAIYAMQKAKMSLSPMIEFQRVLDDLLAFWGIVDDQILDENTRNIIKVGKRVERLDLYGRLRLEREEIVREICRLEGRIDRCQIRYRKESITALKKLAQEEEMNYRQIVTEIEKILEV